MLLVGHCWTRTV